MNSWMANFLTPELRRLEQFQLLAARRARCSSSAKRNNVNSRGRQPTEQRPKRCSTLKGSNHGSSRDMIRKFQIVRRIVRPLQGQGHLRTLSAGCTHGYSGCSPSAYHAFPPFHSGSCWFLKRKPADSFDPERVEQA